MKKKKLTILATTMVVVALTMGIFGCSSGTTESDSSDDSSDSSTVALVTSVTVSEEDAEFDSECLSCHGSYEEVAELTADYGDSNPHDSVHGGYYSCSTCHDSDQVVNEDHLCVTCHEWPRDDQSAL